jgi:hypothetical protein
MALKKCKECGKDVSSSAKTCPYCGVKNPGVTAKTMVLGILTLLFMGWLITQCSLGNNSNNKKSIIGISIPDGTKAETKLLIENNFLKLRAVCPGLDKYAESLKFDGVNDNFESASEDAQSAEIKFLISKNSSGIPLNYMAAGNRCFFEISRDGSRALISKRACQSICLDRDMTQNKKEVLEIPLK